MMRCDWLSKKFKKLKLGLVYTTTWMISKSHNALIFKKTRCSALKISTQKPTYLVQVA